MVSQGESKLDATALAFLFDISKFEASSCRILGGKGARPATNIEAEV